MKTVLYQIPTQNSVSKEGLDAILKSLQTERAEFGLFSHTVGNTLMQRQL